MFRLTSAIRSLITKPQVLPLGRWCHPEYNEKCDVDIKNHLANLDNNYLTTWDKDKATESNKPSMVNVD